MKRDVDLRHRQIGSPDEREEALFGFRPGQGRLVRALEQRPQRWHPRTARMTGK